MISVTSQKHTDGILVNRLNFKIDEIKFNKKYTILRAEYNTFEMRNKAVHILSNFSTVRAIRYEHGGISFYILLEGNSETDFICEKLKRMVLNEPITKKLYHQLPPNIIFELLLIALSHKKCDMEEGEENLAYSNLDGGVYTFDPSDVEKDRIVTLNIKSRAAKDCIELFGDTKLMFSAQSFAAVEKMNETKEDKAYLNTLPRFQVFDNKYMKLSNRLEFGSTNKEYVKHGYRGMKKASIDFLNIYDVSALDKSKMGRVRLTLRKMRREYQDIGLEVNFVRTDLFDGNKYNKKNTGFEKFLKSIWSGKKLYAVDMINSTTSNAILRGVMLDMKKEFNIEVIPVDSVQSGEYNLVIVQKSNRDPNHKTYENSMVQHISIKNFAATYYRKDSKKMAELFDKLQNEFISNSRKSRLIVILSDLVIKYDILNNAQTFYGWYKERILDAEPTNYIDRQWYFYDRVRIENKDPEHKMEAKYSDQMGCLKLDIDGSMSFSLISKLDIKDDFHLKMIWNQFNTGQTNIKGVLSDGDNTYVFLSTDVLMIPETDMIRDKLRSNEKAHAMDNSIPRTGDIRTRNNYELYFKANTDVRYTYVQNECYYFVGVRGDNIYTTLHWAANLLRIRRLEGKENVPEVIFDMMLAPFVRLNRYTIIPYPFKYLREFEKTKGLENFVPENPEEENSGKEKEHQWCLDSFGLI